MTKKEKIVYTRLRDMPSKLADGIREAMIEYATQQPRVPYHEIARRISVAFTTPDVEVRASASTVRGYLREHQEIIEAAREAQNQEPPDEEARMRALIDELQQRGAKFLNEYRTLPPVPDHIKATRVEDMGFDTPQVGVALFSDLHYYSRVDRRASNGLAEYNEDIARERLRRWRNGVLRFTQMNQLWVELTTLYVLALGDELEGHGQIFQSQALQMSDSVIFQLMGFVEDMTGIVLSFLERYPKIVIIKVPGNHGRREARARGAYTPDNLETIAWLMIAERVRNQTGGEWEESPNGVRSLVGGQIEFHVHFGAIALFDILGWLCAARHGHGIKGLQATYTGALDNKFRLNALVGEIIAYYFKGHLHEPQASESEIRGEVIQNGAFSGPTLLSIEMSRPAANLPSQEFMLFHPRRGKTHHYRIHLAEVDEVRRFQVIGRQ